jgi:hypothetical protein
MKTTLVRRNHIMAALALILLFSFSAQMAFASAGTFGVTVAHNINGRSLGLDKDLPVNITIYKDGSELAKINDFRFGETLSTPLPAGNYKITVEVVGVGILDSMQVGPVDIPAGADVFLNARLSGGKTPVVGVTLR